MADETGNPWGTTDPAPTVVGGRDETEARIAQRVRAIREAVGMSQAQVAEAMTKRGYSWQQVTTYKVEKGERKLYLAEARSLAGILGVSIDDLLSPFEPVDKFLSVRLRASADQVVDAIVSLGQDAIHFAGVMREAGRDDATERIQSIMSAAIYAKDYELPGVTIHEFEVGLQVAIDGMNDHTKGRFARDVAAAIERQSGTGDGASAAP
ncbi:helix-turn-helix domain-containing protein [Tsukamurella paurometabola]|uniref:Helix-turn-helix domain n=1 Tax=Tsukamurella paurometabola TaxID=2061 RepID=A0A3P8KR24_TSUPA|nr:helix-turn-helix transcriptional regulator [Tsukamurella paurometabola]UEA81783.1 helix-turn-helix domain-containing protein [Tsukamurella paurometabola]VDR38797.1 Helix-turn-helix domain [Tsukamurella paurometabola]